MSKQSTTIAGDAVHHAATTGKLLFESGMFQDVGTAAQAAVKVLAGREIGIGPIQAMSGLHVIKGKVTMGANLIAALILRSGRYAYSVSRHSDAECVIDDARKAGLMGNSNWKAYPRNMLFARAISNGARWYCADVFSGAVYTPDELRTDDCETFVDKGHEIVEAEFEVAPSPELDDLSRLAALIQKAGVDQKKFLDYYGAELLEQLTTEQRRHAVGELSARCDTPQTK